MNILFKKLPLEIVIYILEYTNVIKYRNGKFMNQISKKDERYEKLSNLSLIECRYSGSQPWRYIRNLGNYQAFLFINTARHIPRYEVTFHKKRQEGDNSPIQLYWYKIK